MISVVIPAYNAEETIVDCVEALLNQRVEDDECEVIVVDDGSTDNTKTLASSAEVLVVECEQRKGAAAARNRGIGIAKGELICFTDADCVPHADWLAQITKPLANRALSGAKGIYETRQREVIARFVQIEYEDKYDRLLGQDQIDFVDTYSAAYRRDVLLANGGFDERIAYVEDQELSFRLASRGYKMVFQPSAVVSHKHSDTIPNYFRKKFMIGYWKAQIVRRFPDRAIRDSHTPQVLKLQMGFVALMLSCALVSFFSQSGVFLLLAATLAMCLTTLPFAHKAWPKDHMVSILSPFLLIVRALALGLGYAWGIVRPRSEIVGTESIGGMNHVLKRLFDIVLGSIGTLLTLLLSPIIGVAIKLDSPGPVLIGQERIGQGGRPITFHRFRSLRMHLATEANVGANQELMNSRAKHSRNRQRFTATGRVLRRWHLDELPRFWNVLVGEMSLVGPLPEDARVVGLYRDWHRRRLAVRPGLISPVQVDGYLDMPLDERVRLEIDYIEHYSLSRDLVLIAKAIVTVVKGASAQQGD